MDENGIDFMVLSFVSACSQGLSHPAKAEALATIAYDELEEEVIKNPTRLAAFTAVSMHDLE
jgi:2,3-dihydroxybenzoate decarboxylase